MQFINNPIKIFLGKKIKYYYIIYKNGFIKRF